MRRELVARSRERVAEPIALAKARREDLVELEKRPRVVERSDRERRRPIAVRVVRALGGRHRREIARPPRERERRAIERPVELELPLDGRDEEARELRRPVDAEAGDLVAHARVLEPGEHGAAVVRSRMPGDLGERRDRLRREESLEVLPHGGNGDRLVDVDDALDRHQIRHARMRRVQHSQLVELPVVHAVGEEGADVLEPGSAGRERVFDHPLPERLRDHRPPVVEPDLLAQPGAIGVGRLRRDAIDHRVGEGARRLDEADELLAPSLADTRDGLPRDVAVARQVVAAENRQRRAARRTASVEAGGDRLDRRVRLRPASSRPR